MEKEIYDREWLIKNKFPHLEKQIRAGDFKLLITDDNRKIARFTNMFPHVYSPDGRTILFIINEFFAEISPDDIVCVSYGLQGMDITTRVNDSGGK
jgi:hypothetical protein